MFSKEFAYSNNEPERKPRRQHNLDLNPNPARTTSFSQLRQRSLSSCAIAAPHKSTIDTMSTNTKKASIGIQHPPPRTEPTIVCMLVDHKSRSTNKDIIAAARAAKAAVKAHRSTSLFSAKSSLPDLAFLKDYADDQPRAKPSANQVLTKAVTNPSIGGGKKRPEQPSMIPVLQTPASSSDLLKRKTLKSIKRYRQTKQNTEPCAFAMPPDTADPQETDRILYDYSQLKQRFIESSQKAASNHSSSSSSSTSSNATNANTPFQRQSSLPSHHSAHVLATGSRLG